MTDAHDLGIANEAAIACAKFVQWAMQEGPWQGNDLDGGSIQDRAESLGLLTRTKFDRSIHHDPNSDAEDGDDWFVLSDAVKALAEGTAVSQSPSAQSDGLVEELIARAEHEYEPTPSQIERDGRLIDSMSGALERAQVEINRLGRERDALRAQLAACRAAFETRETKNGVITSTHALHNLEGAIIDIERQGKADAVSLRTLKRVAEQLAAIEAALAGAGQ